MSVNGSTFAVHIGAIPTETNKPTKMFKCLWKGPDKVTSLSVINTLENGGLNLRL